MNGDKVFLDTNIIIYAYDVTAGRKYETAGDLCANMWEKGTGVISTQVLQEFFVTVTRKIPTPLDTATAKEIVRDLLTWTVIVNDGTTILGAIDLHAKYGYSFWDSLIIQAALEGGAGTLFSEDLSPGQKINDLIITNPFDNDSP